MSMLEQAIVDAKDLREVAKANAEAEVLEKYSSQIKEAVDRLLEQDDEEMEAGDLGAEAEAEVLDLDVAEETSEVEDDLPMSYEAQPADEKEEAEQNRSSRKLSSTALCNAAVSHTRRSAPRRGHALCLASQQRARAENTYRSGRVLHQAALGDVIHHLL